MPLLQFESAERSLASVHLQGWLHRAVRPFDAGCPPQFDVVTHEIVWNTELDAAPPQGFGTLMVQSHTARDVFEEIELKESEGWTVARHTHRVSHFAYDPMAISFRPLPVETEDRDEVELRGKGRRFSLGEAEEMLTSLRIRHPENQGTVIEIRKFRNARNSLFHVFAKLHAAFVQPWGEILSVDMTIDDQEVAATTTNLHGLVYQHACGGLKPHIVPVDAIEIDANTNQPKLPVLQACRLGGESLAEGRCEESLCLYFKHALDIA